MEVYAPASWYVSTPFSATNTDSGSFRVEDEAEDLPSLLDEIYKGGYAMGSYTISKWDGDGSGW